MYFLITESPAKAKKIQTFLDNKKYLVKSSCGHIVDLEKKKLSIDVNNNFKPTYKIFVSITGSKKYPERRVSFPIITLLILFFF